jgi:hypothetical protein
VRGRVCEHQNVTGTELPGIEGLFYPGRVRVHSRTRLFASWLQWNPNLGCGPELEVGSRAIRVSAPQGMMFESRNFSFLTSDTVMWRENFGLLGLPILRRDFIRLSVSNQRRKSDFAIQTSDDTDVVWAALVRAGVSTRSTN